jgi:large subunit ribosomal protein L4
MADKQEIKYKVRKIDGTYGAEGTISLNAIQDGGRYLVHRAFVAQSNKKRQGTASTKTRSEIRGGGKKPSNSPLWNGGGVAFGPRPRSYAHKINIKERRLALTTALHHNFSKVIVVEDLSQGTSQVSTKSAIKNLSSILDFSQTKEKKLVITHAHDKNLALSMRNVRNLKLISANTINIIDLLDTDHILVTESALKHICEVYSE